MAPLCDTRREISLEHVFGELFSTPPVVDDYSSALVGRKPPEDDVLSVVADHMPMTRPVGLAGATIVELKSVSSPSGPTNHLDGISSEVSVRHAPTSL